MPDAQDPIGERERQQAFEILNNLTGRGINYDLGAIQRVLDQRGNPERAFKSLIVAGTNGKGSTSAFIHATLRSFGFRTGLYTSPHLFHVCERLRMADTITESALAAWLLRYAEEGLLDELTYYEALTAIAFEWFRDQEAEWVVLEVGVGGRLDAVNLAPAEGAVITSISLDHRELLGDTVKAIAGEKAGVIKAWKPVVIGDLPVEAKEVIEAVSAQRGALLYPYGTAWGIVPSGKGMIFEGHGFFPVPELGLAGRHQYHNAGCALAAVERIVGLDLASAPEQVRNALRDVQWPGRFQQVGEQPRIVVDGAHNPEAVRALSQAYRDAYGDTPVTVVFGTLADKEYNAMLAALEGVDHFWLTDVEGEPRSLPRETLAQSPALAHRSQETVAPAEVLARLHSAAPDKAFLVTGSIAFVGWFLRHWKPS